FLPNFLYDEETADKIVVHKPDATIVNYENGLMQGFVLVRCYHQIFFGNAFPGPKGSKDSVAKLNGHKHVTPESLAYTAVQGHFSLTSMPEWGMQDGAFDDHLFYQVILNLFDDREDEWVIETLAWWDR
ncbi:hypothetical protein C8J56DRAFT_718541, partial [Mycena floridula]